MLIGQMHQLFHSDSTTCVAYDNIQMKDIPKKRPKKIIWNNQLCLDRTSWMFLLYFTCKLVNFYGFFHKIIKIG